SVAVFLAPVQFQTTPVPWWGIPVAAVVYNMLVFVIDPLVGLNRRRVGGERAHEAAWRYLERLPSMRRNWINEKLRQEELFSTFLSYGFGIALAANPLGSLR